MTDETKKLFDAPWTDSSGSMEDIPYFCIDDAHGQCMVSCHVQYYTSKEKPGIDDDAAEKTKNRILRLPELYDALEDAAERVCKKCVAFWFPGQKFDFPQNFADFICPITKAGCFCENWLNLLQKVRDGK